MKCTCFPGLSLKESNLFSISSTSSVPTTCEDGVVVTASASSPPGTCKDML